MDTMAIGLVSQSDLEKELVNLGVDVGQSTPGIPESDTPTPEVTEGEVEQIVRRGRARGDNNVPASLRNILAETAMMDGRQAAIELAREFGISPSSVSAYSNGSTSTTTYNQPKSEIISHINKTRERAVKKAGKTLNAALAAITQEKLDYESADKLAGIAKDMSAIIKNLEPQKVEEGDDKSVPRFVIFAPQFRDERTFESIHVTE